MLLDTEILIRGMNIAEFARRIGVSRSALASVCRGEAAITAEMALRISKFTGGDAASWLAMQGSFDLWKASKRIGIRYRDHSMDGYVMVEGALEKQLAENISRLSDELLASQRKRGARRALPTAKEKRGVLARND